MSHNATGSEMIGPDAEREALKLALLFHDAYERLAPEFQYDTRKETRQFDPASPNGRLMIAVCSEVAATLTTRAERAEAERDLFRNTAKGALAECVRLREALVTVESEIMLDGQLAEIVQNALATNGRGEP